MSEIKIIKTPWCRMIKVKRKIKNWNKKYNNKPLTIKEAQKAILDYD